MVNRSSAQRNARASFGGEGLKMEGECV